MHDPAPARPTTLVLAPAATLALLLGLLLVPGTAGAAATGPASAVAAAAAAAHGATGQGATGQGVAGRAAAVRLRAARAKVTVGTRVRLVGKTRARRGATVRIQVKVPGRPRWRRAGRVPVQAEGRFRRLAPVRTTGVHRFRACVQRPARCSRPVKVRVRARGADRPRARVTVAPLSGTYEVGQAATVAGTAASHLAGRRLRLQATDAGAGADASWATLAAATVAADGSFSLSGPLPTAGRRIALRVVAPLTPRTRRTVVPAGTLEVFGWYYLHDGGPVAEAAGDWCPLKEERTVAGARAPRSIGFGYNCKDANQAEVDLAEQCRTFEARVGLSDAPADTTSNVRYAVRLLVDGAPGFHQPEIAPGQVWDVRMDLTGAGRLRLEAPFVSGTHGLVVLGGARVYCAL